MASQQRDLSVEVIDPSLGDVTMALAEILPVLRGKRSTCQRAQHSFTFPGASAFLRIYVQTGMLNLITVSPNGERLDELMVPTDRLTSTNPDVHKAMEPLVPFVTKSLRIANALCIAKKVGNPSRYPAFKIYTSDRRYIQIDVRHGHLRMYRSGKTVVLAEYPDAGIYWGSKRRVHCFELDTLCDAKFYRCIDKVKFPHPKPQASESQVSAESCSPSQQASA